MMDLLRDTYRSLLIRTKRGNSRGVVKNAKPILVIAIIDAIEEGIILGNKIIFGDPQIKRIYENDFRSCSSNGGSLHRANIKVTPYNMPFFHLNAEPYYHIKWNDGVIPPEQAKSPSSLFLQDNVDYAYLDDDLWELLQDQEIRDEFRNLIINHFINTDK